MENYDKMKKLPFEWQKDCSTSSNFFFLSLFIFSTFGCVEINGHTDKICIRFNDLFTKELVKFKLNCAEIDQMKIENVLDFKMNLFSSWLIFFFCNVRLNSPHTVFSHRRRSPFNKTICQIRFN